MAKHVSGRQLDLQSVDSGVGHDQQSLTAHEGNVQRRSFWRQRKTHQIPEWKRELTNAFKEFPSEPLASERRVEYHKNGLNYDCHHLLTQTDYERFLRDQTQHCPRSQANKSGCSSVMGDDLHFTETVRSWASRSKVWSSKTLHVNLALDIPRKQPPGIKTIMFIASLDQSPGLFLFIYFDTRTDCKTYENFTVFVARFLRECLTKIIPNEFPYILPLAFQAQQHFSKETIRKAVEKNWCDDLSADRPQNARQYFDKGPTRLSEKQLEQMEQAVFLLHSLSIVPSCFSLDGGGGEGAGGEGAEGAKTTYIMDPNHTDAVLHIIQGMTSDKHGGQNITCDLHDPKVCCAIVEAAKRLAFSGPVHIFTDSKLVSDTVSALQRHQKKLLLIVGQMSETLTYGKLWPHLVFEDSKDIESGLKENVCMVLGNMASEISGVD